MELIPAIDLLGGRVVRLRQGRYEDVEVFAEDAADAAAAFEARGVRRLHVVDLDGARDGRPGNVDSIRRILARTSLAVQVGGGVRTREVAEAWYEAGAERVVLGTAAVRDPELARSLAAARPGGVVVALDARAGEVAVAGWLEGSGRRVEELAEQVDAWGVAAILYTSIERDGMGSGPDVEGTAALQRRVGATVIASGGVGSAEHLRALRRAGVRASVCGRALHDGTLSIEAAVAAAGGLEGGEG